MTTMTTQRPTRAPDRQYSVSTVGLTDAQRAVRDACLNLLGIDGGYLTGDGLADAGHRQTVSRLAADTLGLHLKAGHEIGQCVDCLHVTDGQYLAECADNALRCEDCQPAHLADLGE